MDETAELAVQAATEAGQLLREGFTRPTGVAKKGRREIVTDLDRASEKAIIEIIRARCPDDAIIAEESSPDQASSERVWIVDPLDGTNNYAHGYPFFSVAVAVEERGALAAGVVYDPLRDELFVASTGSGATLNGVPVRVSTSETLGDSLVATGFPYDRSETSESNLGNLNRFILRVRGIRRGGSAALDLAYVACGRLDGFWELGLKTWDVAAGGLLVAEAAGNVTNFSAPGWNHRRGDIVASNGRIHDEMLAVITGTRVREGRSSDPAPAG